MRADGHDVLSVRDLDPRAPDETVLRWAVEQQRLLVTMDKDFGEMAARTPGAHGGVLVLRTEAAAGEEKAQVLRNILRTHGEAVIGRLSVYRAGRLRLSR